MLARPHISDTVSPSPERRTSLTITAKLSTRTGLRTPFSPIIVKSVITDSCTQRFSARLVPCTALKRGVEARTFGHVIKGRALFRTPFHGLRIKPRVVRGNLELGSIFFSRLFLALDPSLLGWLCGVFRGGIRRLHTPSCQCDIQQRQATGVQGCRQEAHAKGKKPWSVPRPRRPCP